MNAQTVQAEFLAPDSLEEFASELQATGYESLINVLSRALFQAAHGKGAERHAQGSPFDQQPMQKLIDLYGQGFALGQAAKKMQEAQRLPRDRAVAEMLGAINYIAGAVIALEREAPVAATTSSEAANDAALPVITALPGADGWTDWHGGIPPVGQYVNVEVVLRGTEGTHTGWAMHWNWRHGTSDPAHEVIQYRIHTPTPEAA